MCLLPVTVFCPSVRLLQKSSTMDISRMSCRWKPDSWFHQSCQYAMSWEPWSHSGACMNEFKQPLILRRITVTDRVSFFLSLFKYFICSFSFSEHKDTEQPEQLPPSPHLLPQSKLGPPPSPPKKVRWKLHTATSMSLCGHLLLQ